MGLDIVIKKVWVNIFLSELTLEFKGNIGGYPKGDLDCGPAQPSLFYIFLTNSHFLSIILIIFIRTILWQYLWNIILSSVLCFLFITPYYGTDANINWLVAIARSFSYLATNVGIRPIHDQVVNPIPLPCLWFLNKPEYGKTTCSLSDDILDFLNFWHTF